MFILVRILDEDVDIGELADSLSKLAEGKDWMFYLTRSRLDIEVMERDDVERLVEEADDYLLRTV